MENLSQTIPPEHIDKETLPPKTSSNFSEFKILTTIIAMVLIIFIVTVLYLISAHRAKQTELSKNSVLLPFTAIPTIDYKNVVQIRGSTMSPNFKNGEYYLVDRNFYDINPIERGDVVILTQEPAIKYSRTIESLRRVIGLPGESVKISKGKIYINGNLLSERYLAPNTEAILYPGSFIQEGVSYTVSPGHYFVLSDDRIYLSGSEKQLFISKNNIAGKILTRLENYIPPTASPEEIKIKDRDDWIELIGTKIAILQSMKNACSTIPSYENSQLKCLINEERNCNLYNLTNQQLQELNDLSANAITDCIHYQDGGNAKQ